MEPARVTPKTRASDPTQEIPPSYLPTPSRPRWHLIYFVLAGFDLLTVLLGLHLSHRITRIYADSVAVNQQWAERVGTYDQLRRLAGAVNAPGNDIFDSHSVVVERTRMQDARTRFDTEMAAAKTELASRVSPTIATHLLEELRSIEDAVDNMSAEAGLIFSYFERGRRERAGERMATMDRKYALVHRAFEHLNERVRTIQAIHFRDQMAAAGTVQRFEWIIGAFVLLMVSGATAYGHHLFTQAAVTARRREYDQNLQAKLESEQAFRTLIEYGSDIILMLDRERTIRYASPSATRALGLGAGELLGRPASSLVHPEDAPDFSERCGRAFDAPGDEFSVQCRVRHADGSWRTVEAVGHAAARPPFATTEGIGLILNARDVTERTREQATLRESQRTLSTLIGNLPGMVYRCQNDPNWTMTYVSDGCYDLTGYRPTEMEQNRLVAYADLVHPDDRDRLWAKCRQSLDARRPCSNEYRIVAKSGEIKWVWERAAGIYSPDGALLNIEGFITDVTERRRAEAERQAIEARFSDILNIAADAIIAVDQEQRVVLFNHGAERIFGYRADEIVGRPLDLLIPESSVAAHRDHVRTFAAGSDAARSMEGRRPVSGRRKDGTAFPAEASISKVLYNGRPIFTAILRDMTERRRAEQSLETSEQRYRGLVENMHEMLTEMSPEGTIQFVNRALCTVTGYEESEMLGSNFFSYLHPDDLVRTRQHCEQLRRDHQPIRRCEYRIRKKDGEYLSVVTNGDPLCDPAGTLKSVVQVSFDLTEHKQAEETILRLAYYDALTGLPNRTLLLDRLTQAVHVGERSQRPVALAIMDLDDFKEINNTLGHHHGDLLLQQLAARLTALLRDSDTVARLGGDEFAVLLPDTDLTGALRVGEKIRSALASPFTLEALSITVETSIGVAVFPDHADTADLLLQRANVAMYAAKQTRSGQAAYASEHDHYSPRRLALMGELRYAIEHNELVVHYQPKIELPTRRVVGVEALVRWRHPHRGLIAPDEFIPLAEQTGLIKPLTQWVLTCARDQARRWRDAGRRLTIAVNLSARTLHDSALPEFVEALTRGAPSWLELEITESTIMGDPLRALDVLKRLHTMAVPLAIDDFGTGYSSLAYLKKLPVTAIKIDKSFIKNMADDENDATIVHSTIDLAHNLGLSVVAEGVETLETLNRLTALGCDAIQGYYVCRPMPSEELDRWFLEAGWPIAGDETPSRAQAA